MSQHPRSHAASSRPINITYGDPEVAGACDLLPAGAFHRDGESSGVRRGIREATGWPEIGTGKPWQPQSSTNLLGPHSHTVRSRFFSCTAGWHKPPTAEEFHEAVQACQKPVADGQPVPVTPRQQEIIRTWLREAEPGEMVLAWLEEAYEWRELVAAAHVVGYYRNELNYFLNQFACESDG